MHDSLDIAEVEELIALRHDLHLHPELGFEENRTATVVSAALRRQGIDVIEGIAGTGLVAVIEGDKTGPMIGLRAEMDALPIEEAASSPLRSKYPGKFHGCGHDGHMAILLGAARLLAKRKDLPGRVALIFQPAEEGLGGARGMIADNLFGRFPCMEVYALHNAPDQPFGTVALRSGAIQAGADFFDIVVRGVGGHAAFPHRATNPIQAAVAIAQALDAIIGTSVDPNEVATFAITRIDAGTTYNVIPDEARISGTIRCFSPGARQAIAARISSLASGIAAAHSMTADVVIRDIFSVLVNHPLQTDAVRQEAIRQLGTERVDIAPLPRTTSEDFADMLQAIPGAYFFLGQGIGPGLHNPNYQFNDELIPVGASLLAGIARSRLDEMAAA